MRLFKKMRETKPVVSGDQLFAREDERVRDVQQK